MIVPSRYDAYLRGVRCQRDQLTLTDTLIPFPLGKICHLLIHF